MGSVESHQNTFYYEKSVKLCMKNLEVCHIANIISTSVKFSDCAGGSCAVDQEGGLWLWGLVPPPTADSNLSKVSQPSSPSL
jgi:hypothetical protein